MPGSGGPYLLMTANTALTQRSAAHEVDRQRHPKGRDPDSWQGLGRARGRKQRRSGERLDG
jgi:hypothetical protein